MGPTADCSESCDDGADNCSANDPDGSTCDNGAYCDGTDTCSAGSCSNHGGNPCAGEDVGPSCNDSCDDGTDSCTAADLAGTSCSDGLYCNGADTCNGSGTCGHGGDPCSTNYADADCAGTCNEGSDNCSGAEPNGSPCDDSVYCNGADTCNSSGSCATHAGSPCSTDYSDADCAGACSEANKNCLGPEPDGSNCDDALYCNGSDRCNAIGGCALHGVDPCAAYLGDHDTDCSESCNEATNACTANDPLESPCGNTGNGCCNANGTCLTLCP
jgi:hypothetical protein